MFEKVNPSHPDKVADRIAGALVDLAYKNQENPKVATEVLIGHNKCYIVGESSYKFKKEDIQKIVDRISDKKCSLTLQITSQDKHLAKNQENEVRCGDNGIFKGVPTSDEEIELTWFVLAMYKGIYFDDNPTNPKYDTDGKYICDFKNHKLICCQSNLKRPAFFEKCINQFKNECNIEHILINPLGDWSGGINVDTGATNRKLGSDMGRAATGGGLQGKDCTKSDVSVNIYCYLLAQRLQKEVQAVCAIGDKNVKFYVDDITFEVPFAEIVATAKTYIDSLGGFEKLAEWGLIR